MRKAFFLAALALGVSLVSTGCVGFGGQLGLGTALPGSIIHNQIRPGYDSVANGFSLRSDNGFKFVGAVTAESSSTSILGAAASGEGGFGKLYDQAKANGGDDVINIRTDVEYNNILGVYLAAKTKWYGVAIKYNTGG
jgi:hypothetical protein